MIIFLQHPRENRSPLDERELHDVLPPIKQDVERIERDVRGRRAEILQEIKVRFPLLIVSDQLTIDHGVIRQRFRVIQRQESNRFVIWVPRRE